jgi:enoyl-CoA hydratase/carnithine racemase
MANALTQFTITEVIPGYWRVTFSNPPINLEDPDTILELQELVGRIEADHALRVVVLDSAHPDFFVNHYDVSRAAETPVEPGPTGLPAFIDPTTRLTNSPVVTIASIRGRTRGGGAELAAACDMRFASLERAIFGQPEVGAGLLPGGGGIERLRLFVPDVQPLDAAVAAQCVGKAVQRVTRQPVDAADAAGHQVRDDRVGDGTHYRVRKSVTL